MSPAVQERRFRRVLAVQERRLRRVLIAPGVLFNTLKLGATVWCAAEGIPIDATWVNAHFDPETGCFGIVVAHGSFESVPLGEMIPVATPPLLRRMRSGEVVP